jgi:hypothetical protein
MRVPAQDPRPRPSYKAGIRSLTGGLHLMQRFLYSAIDLVKSLHFGFLFLKKGEAGRSGLAFVNVPLWSFTARNASPETLEEP